MTCKDKQENNGVCPHHNLHCGWPKCNEPEQPSQQEPVTGCVCRWNSEGDRVVTCERHQGWLEVIAEWADRARDAEKKLKALNTSPQPAQRTWVGLTLEDMETLHWSPDFRAGAKWAAAKLNEKNT